MKKSRLKSIFVHPLHQSWCVVFFCCGVIIGTILSLIFRLNFFASAWFLALAGILGIISYVRPLFAFAILALLAGFLVSFFRIATELSGVNYIANLQNQTILVTGDVAADPDTDDSATKFKIKNLEFGTEKIEARGTLYVSTGKNEEIKWGDRITLEGKLLPGFGTYAGYLYRPSIKNLARPDPGSLILRLRNWFATRIESKIGETESKLGLSYLLGMKTGLPEDLSTSLRVVGLTHIVVASGAHLSILVEVARKIFGKLSRFAGLLFSLLFILFFMALVGWTPSILRAGLMTILTLLTWYVGRKIAPWRLILLVAAVTLLLNPMFLIDLGWLLSFASYAGIMLLGPRLTRFFFGHRRPGFIAETIMMTIAATLMTLPISLYSFGQISLISLAANFLILPTLPYAMGLTFATGVVASIPIASTAVAFCAEKLLDFHIFVVGFLGQATNFLITIPPGNPHVFWLYAPLIIGLFAGKVVKLKQVKLKSE